jgi:eukaryotic-like serine/threonine-protein kinase
MGRAEPGGVLAGRYRLSAVLRRDEMGTVWLARDSLLHRDVVVRAVCMASTPGEAELESPHHRVLRDARALAKLDHPNIPVVFDVVEDDGRTWMVLQAAPYRFPYRSLSDVVHDDGPLRPRWVAEAGFQILSALRAAHAVGVVHGDIRPGNVLLGPGNRAMLTGFGMITADDSWAAPAESLWYLAPERAIGQPATPAADLWSLGATLYTAVEGRPPFHGDGEAAVRAAVASGYPDPPSRAGPLWPALSGLLRRDADARPDPAGVDWLLRRVAAGGDTAGPVPPPEPAGRPAGAAPAPGSPPTANQDGAAAAASPAAVSPAAAADDGPAGSAADFIPGFGPRGPAPAGEAAEFEDPPSREPPQGHGRRRWFFAATGGTVLIAAVAAVIVATVPASLRAAGHPLAVADLGAGAGRTASGHLTGAPAGPDAVGARHGPPPGPATRGPVHAVPPVRGTGVLPARFSWYRDPTGFSIAVPPGWRVSRQGHRVYVRDPHSRRFLVIIWTTHPRPHPLADWRRQAAARVGSYPGYRRIRLAAVRYAPAERTADWAFTYYRNGQLTRVLRRNILASARHGYVLSWSVPAYRWRGSFHYFRAFAAAFRPPASVRGG